MERQPARTHPAAMSVALGPTVAFAAGRVALAIAHPEPTPGSADDPFGGGLPLAVLDALALVIFAIVGAVVTRKQPTNPVGWILCAIPVSLGALLLSSNAYEYLVVDPIPSGFATVFAAWLASWVWIPFAVPALTLFPLLFPSGRPLDSSVATGHDEVALSLPMVFVGVAFAPGRLEDYPEVENPFGANGDFERPVVIIGEVGFALMLVATAGFSGFAGGALPPLARRRTAADQMGPTAAAPVRRHRSPSRRTTSSTKMPASLSPAARPADRRRAPWPSRC